MATSYITQAELEALALPPGAQGSLDAGTLATIIERASAEADTHLRSRYTLPLLSWESDLKGWVADIAGLFCLRRIGTNPESDDYKIFKDAHDAAVANLILVSKRLMHPDIVDSAKRVRVPRAASKPLRGW